MASPNLFYKYYDTLYRDKDYIKEINSIFNIAARYNLDPFEHVLDIGCGTGNHAFVMAQKGVHVTAHDIDEDMIRMAQNKAGHHNINFTSQPLAAMKGSNFDLAVALFHVITYIPDEAALNSIFSSVRVSMRSGGLFIFDCWNGEAVRKDPPKEKGFTVTQEQNKISCQITSKMDDLKQKTVLNYHIILYNNEGGIIEEDHFKIPQTLWTRTQLQKALNAAGIEVLHVCQPYHFDAAASESDWKIMFITRCI